jgi:hypothetical protein
MVNGINPTGRDNREPSGFSPTEITPHLQDSAATIPFDRCYIRAVLQIFYVHSAIRTVDERALLETLRALRTFTL